MLELEQVPKIVVCDDKPEVHKQIETLLSEYIASISAKNHLLKLFPMEMRY